MRNAFTFLIGVFCICTSFYPDTRDFTLSSPEFSEFACIRTPSPSELVQEGGNKCRDAFPPQAYGFLKLDSADDPSNDGGDFENNQTKYIYVKAEGSVQCGQFALNAKTGGGSGLSTCFVSSVPGPECISSSCTTDPCTLTDIGRWEPICNDQLFLGCNGPYTINDGVKSVTFHGYEIDLLDPNVSYWYYEITDVTGENPNISHLTFAYLSCISGNILPVEFSEFNVELIGDSDIKLKWTTHAEINNEGFYIERSTNGGEFQEIGYVAGQENISNVKKYSFMDDSPKTSFNYTYRLKQMDYNGNSSFSDAKTIELDHIRDIVVYPNPVFDRVNILYPRGYKISELELFNMAGQSLKNINIESETTDVGIDLSDVVEGIYLLRITSNNNMYTRRLIVN